MTSEQVWALYIGVCDPMPSMFSLDAFAAIMLASRVAKERGQRCWLRSSSRSIHVSAQGRTFEDYDGGH